MTWSLCDDKLTRIQDYNLSTFKIYFTFETTTHKWLIQKYKDRGVAGWSFMVWRLKTERLWSTIATLNQNPAFVKILRGVADKYSNILLRQEILHTSEVNMYLADNILQTIFDRNDWHYRGFEPKDSGRGTSAKKISQGGGIASAPTLNIITISMMIIIFVIFVIIIDEEGIIIIVIIIDDGGVCAVDSLKRYRRGPGDRWAGRHSTNTQRDGQSLRVPFIMMIINDYHQQRGQQCTWSSFDGHHDRQHDHIWFRADGQCESVLSGRFFLRRWQVREGIAGGPKRQNSVQIHESICFHSELSLLL